MRLVTRFSSWLLAAAVAATPLAALADRPDKPGKPDKAAGAPKAARPGDGGGGGFLIEASLTFGDARRLAQEHGATGYKPLPPGIRKNLARGKPMPPGIAKTRAPQGMLQALPRHEGYEWRVAGTDLLLVQLGTALVADVLTDVFD